MAITDNAFTAEELQTAIAANPTLIEQVRTGLGDGFHLNTKDEFNTFVQKTKDDTISETTASIYSRIDQDVLTLTGIKKGSEKTHEYISRVFSEQKTSFAALEATKKELEAKIAENGDQTLKAQYDALIIEYNKQKDEVIPTLQKSLFETKVQTVISQATEGLDFNPAYDQTVIDTLLSAAKQRMLASAKQNGEAIEFLDENGKPYMNGINFAQPAEIFKSFIPASAFGQRQASGGGTGGSKGTGHKNASGVEIVIPETIKTKVALHEFLKANGLSEVSKEFMEIDNQYKELPIQ